jgi:sugar phosphate permease
VLQIPAGWVVDRYGVKLPYSVSFLFWCVASALTAFTGSLHSLYALRVLVEAGEAVVAPASYRWIRVNFEEKERGLAIGLYMTGTKIGPAIAAPLAAWLVLHSDWRAMFLIVGAGGLVWLVPWLLLVDNDRPRRPKAAAAPSAEAVPFARVLASPVTWGAVIATFCYMYFVYFCMTWMPAYFVEQRHLTLARMGLYTFFSFGGMAIVAALAGWACRSSDRPRRQPGHRAEMVHHRRLRRGLHGVDRCPVAVCHGGAGIRRDLALRPGPGHRQLLGPYPDSDPRRRHRPHFRRAELLGQRRRHRRPHPHRLAQTADRKLPGSDAGHLVFPGRGRSRLRVPGSRKIRSPSRRAG